MGVAADVVEIYLRGILWYFSHQIGERWRRRAWRSSAAAHRLTHLVSHGGFALRGTLQGRAGQRRVRFETISFDLEHVGTRIAVDLPGRVAAGVRLRAQAVGKGPEIEVGDPRFDAAFHVGGSPAAVLALLDSGTRARLLKVEKEISARDGHLALVAGELRAEIKEAHSPDLERDLAVVLGILLEIASALGQTADIPARLADHALHDPEPGVRLQNLLALSREFREHERTVPTLRAACRDESLEIRVRAAGALGDEGRDVLLDIAESESADDTSAARAIYSLEHRLPPERAQAILDRALRTRRRGTALACLERLGRTGAGAVRTLAKVAALESGDLAVAATRALGSTDCVEAEAPLLRLLERAVPGMAFAAAEALGRVGSSAAVLSLHELERARDRDLQRAARQAIAQIQGRLKGASPGQLSIAGADAGQLSVAEHAAGQLSAAEPQAGQVSMAPEGAAGRLSRPGDEDDRRRE